MARIVQYIDTFFINVGRRTKIVLLVLILLALLAATYSLTSLLFHDKTDISLLARKVDSIVLSNLARPHMGHSDIRKNYVPKQNGEYTWEQIEVAVTLDESQSVAGLCNALKQELSRSNLTIKEEKITGSAALNELRLSVWFGNVPIYQLLVRHKPPAPNLEAPREDVAVEEEHDSMTAQEDAIVEDERFSMTKREGLIVGKESIKIAVIVDDVGYDIKNAIRLLELRRPMTISIFPQLKYSRHIAELAHDMGFEVMMHLPMDSGKRLRRNPGFVAAHMNESEIAWVLDKDFNSIPYIIGVNNHQGSLMTTDPEAMRHVVKYLAKKNVFFIDSRTTSESVAYDVAKEYGLRAAENDLFLDNDKDVDYIKGQIRMLMDEARQKGKAIGICHIHPATIQAFEEMFPVIESNDIELVFASTLVH